MADRIYNHTLSITEGLDAVAEQLKAEGLLFSGFDWSIGVQGFGIH